MERLAFSDLIDINSLQMMQDSFAKFTGLAICVVDARGKLAVKPSGGTDFCDKYTKCSGKGIARCHDCDMKAASKVLSEGKAIHYTCHAGMTDFAIPIAFENRIIGGILAGKVRSDELDEEKLRDIASELGIDPDGYIEAAKRVRYVTKEQAEEITVFFEEFARALSAMAFANYKKIKEIEKAEHTARAQSDFITELTGNLRESMRGWIDSFYTASRKYDHLPDVKAQTDELLFRAGEVYSEIGGAVDYIRMAGGSAEYSEDIYNVRDFIGRTAAPLEKTAYDAGIVLTASCGDSVPETLAGNSGRIGQIISRLGSSVVSFTNAFGNIDINVSCEKADYSCRLIVRIRGTGTRMTEKAAEAIRFAIKGGANAFNGSGRLTPDDTDFSFIVTLLRQMSGSIEAESLEDGDVSFKITVPQLDGSKRNV